jgi:5-methylthioadenosine/S-adenosylhomocysteine deaminase
MIDTRRRCSWVLLLAAFVGSVFHAATVSAQDSEYALAGTLITPYGIVENGTVVVAHGTIQAVGVDLPLRSGIPVIKTDGVIVAGLIDLHNHLVWNVFPRWKPPGPQGNRYDWQDLDDYKKKLPGPEQRLIDRGTGCDMERYAEIKALLGGATSLVGSYSPTDSDPKRNECDRGLARNLDFASGLYSQEINSEPLEYDVFPFELPVVKAQSVRDGLCSGKLKAALFHVAEGKDASAAREFRMFKAAGLLRPGVSVIHGVALRAADFQDMAANRVGLIWSPHSNLELYAKTTDVAAAKAANVIIAIAPDWSPSGSDNLLEELRYIRSNTNVPKVFSEAELVQMVTSNPAKLAGAGDRIGALTAGMMADITVLPKRGNSALAAVLDSEPGTIKLVIVGGKPILGEAAFMQQLLPGQKLDSLTVCRHEKSLNIAGDTEGRTWSQIVTHLTDELKRENLTLAELQECN